MHTLYEMTVTGLVQGVGFRPYVCQLGNKLNIRGSVSNIGGQVLIKVYESLDDARLLSQNLKNLTMGNKILPGSRVDEILVNQKTTNEIPPINFIINNSYDVHDKIRFIPVDYCTCESCKKELLDSNNRRYRYPFISCVACGPRISILYKLPYDRDNITMKDFPMCDECQIEYTTIGNIRHFAQTIACHTCGPKLIYKDKKSKLYGEDAFTLAVNKIKNGGVLAIKDIGGYHFVCDATNPKAIAKLRDIKKRQNKPFAVMFKSVDDIKQIAQVSKIEAEILNSNARPIVLVNKNKDYNLPDIIDDNSLRIGAMLPSNPLQILLMEEFISLIMTSGNLAGEPIIKKDDEIIDYVENGLIDGSLYNDREIINSLDDSIIKVTRINDSDIIQIIRRARGYVPEPIKINKILENDTYASGGDLKSVFAYGRKNYITLSGHFGDLEDYCANKEKQRFSKVLKNLLDLSPKDFICDRHPGYISTKDTTILANEVNAKPIKIQHHHAHIASVMAEHSLNECIGIALDGTGYGNDGNIWGGEFMYCKENDFERIGHLDYIDLIGGNSATKDIDKSCMVAMIQCINKKLVDEESLINHPILKRYVGSATLDVLKTALKNKINTYTTSSAGRLFDIVAVLLNICSKNSYEGEAPIKLEQMARTYMKENKIIDNAPLIPVIIKKKNNELLIDTLSLIADIFKLYITGMKSDELAFEFHKSIAKALSNVCEEIREIKNTNTVCLSGGCFNNSLLLTLLIPQLEKKGFNVYLNSKVPCGDGGIALGQIYLNAK